MAQHTALSLAPATGSIEAYIQSAYQTPILSHEEEQRLGQAWQRSGDTEAARRLVLAHIRYVIHVARGYVGFGLPLADLVQEGTVGLMKAVKRFDPNVGVRLVSFAVHWIKSEIHEFILRHWSIVKIATTKAQRKLFFNLHKQVKGGKSLTQEDVDRIANDLNVSAHDVRTMELRLMGHGDEPFEPSPCTQEGSAPVSPSEVLHHEHDDPAVALEQTNWMDHQSSAMRGALSNLEARSQRVVEARWLSPQKATLQTLSHELGVSIERVRQLEKQALLKLRRHLADASIHNLPS